MEVDRRWNRARLSTPKVFVQVIVVVFGGLTESRTDGSECFQSKSVTQNPQFALFIQNELELRSRRKNLGISLWQPRFRFSFRHFGHLAPFIAAIRVSNRCWAVYAVQLSYQNTPQRGPGRGLLL